MLALHKGIVRIGFSLIMRMFFKIFFNSKFFRFCIVGGVNTLFTVSIIFIMIHLNYGPYFSNAVGFSGGIILSFIMNSILTFKERIKFERFIKFLITCGMCYSLNFFVLFLVKLLYPNVMFVNQLLGMLVYTGSNFYISKKWAYK